MTGHVRFGQSTDTSVSSWSVPADRIQQTIEDLVEDDTVVNAYYYPHPSGPATWVKGDSASHAALTQAINEGGTVMDTDVWAALAEIERLVSVARVSLDDEREGDFTTTIEELATEADRLRALVRSW